MSTYRVTINYTQDVSFPQMKTYNNNNDIFQAIAHSSFDMHTMVIKVTLQKE